MKNLRFFLSKKWKGMALPLTLVILLVTGAMVAVSMYFIENMFYTTKMKTDTELRMNAAITGVENGKQLILEKIKEGKPLRISSADIDGIDVNNVDDLLAKIWVGGGTGSIDGVAVTTDIYDLKYVISSDLEFASRIPPLINISFEFDLSQSSRVQRQSYDASNRGGGSPEGFAMVEGKFNAYLIRSTATLNGIPKTIEQAVVMRQ